MPSPISETTALTADSMVSSTSALRPSRGEVTLSSLSSSLSAEASDRWPSAAARASSPRIEAASRPSRKYSSTWASRSSWERPFHGRALLSLWVHLSRKLEISQATRS